MSRQQTGFYDGNGQEIHEGDIISGISPDGNYRWTFQVVQAGDGWKLEPVAGTKTFEIIDGVRYVITWGIDGVAHFGLSIIGNIYDNPGLLEGSEDICKQ